MNSHRIINSLRIMKSPNQPENIFDLSLQHSLKNWAAHKNPPSGGRENLLATVQHEVSTPKRKPLKLKFGRFFHLKESQQRYLIRPVNNYEFEYIDFLKTMMVFL